MNVIGEEILSVVFGKGVNVHKLIALGGCYVTNYIRDFCHNCGVDIVVCKSLCFALGIVCHGGSCKDDAKVGIILLILGEALQILLAEGFLALPILGL